MLAPHLAGWDTVTVDHRSDERSRCQLLLGTWVRREGGIAWEAATEPDSYSKPGP
jgi:hypothetical protein